MEYNGYLHFGTVKGGNRASFLESGIGFTFGFENVEVDISKTCFF